MRAGHEGFGGAGRAADMTGRSRNEHTPGGAAHTTGTAFTARAAVPVQAPMLASGSSIQQEP
jgi:hypothetical protein